MSNKDNMKIEEINKGNPFKVSENYFENFSIRMADKISETKSAKPPVHVHAWLRPKYAAFLAFASILLILLVGIVFVNYRTKPLSSKEMVEIYKYSAIQDLSDEQLAQIIAEKQETSDTTNRYKDEVIEFLSKDNIDINTIIDVQ